MINTLKKSGFGLSRKASLLAATLGVLCIGEASATFAITDDQTGTAYTSPWTVTGKVRASSSGAAGTLAALTLNPGAELYLNCSAFAVTLSSVTLNAGSKLHLLLGAAQAITALTMNKGASLTVAGTADQTITGLTLNDPNVYFGLSTGLTVTTFNSVPSVATVFEFLNPNGATLTDTAAGTRACTLKMTKNGTLAGMVGLSGVISGPGSLTLPGAAFKITSEGKSRNKGSINISKALTLFDCSIFGTGTSDIGASVTYTPTQKFDGTYDAGNFAGTLNITGTSAFASDSAPLQIAAVAGVTSTNTLTFSSATATTIGSFTGSALPTVSGPTVIRKATITGTAPSNITIG